MYVYKQGNRQDNCNHCNQLQQLSLRKYRIIIYDMNFRKHLIVDIFALLVCVKISFGNPSINFLNLGIFDFFQNELLFNTFCVKNLVPTENPQISFLSTLTVPTHDPRLTNLSTLTVQLINVRKVKNLQQFFSILYCVRYFPAELNFEYLHWLYGVSEQAYKVVIIKLYSGMTFQLYFL